MEQPADRDGTYRAALDRLSGNGAVITAARLGRLFRVNPLSILDCDREDWLLWQACGLVVQQDQQDEADEAERQSR